jgi:dTMP kinase
MKKGKFIVVDGGEGAGKTAVIRTLAKIFPAGKILATHEPGGAPFADKIREIFLSKGARNASAEAMFSLVWAARADHLKRKIIPALKEGKTVVCDRFDSSTYAYQIFAQKAPHLKKLFWEIRKVYLREAKPDLYIFFDVEPKTGLARVANRRGEKTHFDKRKLDFHQSVRKGFKEFFKQVPHKIIDANQSIDEVKNDFLKVVSDLTRS